MWERRWDDLSNGWGIRLCMSHEVDLFGRLKVPQVHSEDEVRRIERVDVYLLLCICIHDYESDARWWCDGTSILVTKTTHTGSNRLLHHIQGPDLAVIYPRFRQRSWVITVICLVETVILRTGRDLIL